MTDKTSLMNHGASGDMKDWDTPLMRDDEINIETDLKTTNPFEVDREDMEGEEERPRHVIAEPVKTVLPPQSKNQQKKKPKSENAALDSDKPPKPTKQQSTSSIDKNKGNQSSNQTIEYEDFFGLFSNDEKKNEDKTSKQNPTNGKKQEKTETDNNQDDPFQFFDNTFQQSKKEDDASSESNEDEMSEEEHNRMKNLFVTDDLPPASTNASKTKDANPYALTQPRGKARKSEPIKTATGEGIMIPERKLGVNPGRDGTNVRVHEDTRQEQSGMRPESSGQTNMKQQEGSSSPHDSKTPVEQTKTTSKYDCLPELKRGTALLKYGRQGYPHFRQFNISQNHNELVWFSNKKKLDQSSIRIKDINEVLTGQHTKEFERIAWKTLEPASFTIWYDGHTRSLNLVAKSVDEMKMWVEALRSLREKASRGEDLSKLRCLEVSVDFKDRNRPQSRKHSGNFLRSNETKEREVNPMLYLQLMDELKNLHKTFLEVKQLAQNEVVQKSHEGTSINQILSELEERIEELRHEVSNTRSTKIAENDVWRTRIDIQALREKITVLIKENKKSKRRFSVF